MCGCLQSQGLELINGVNKERIFSDGSREFRYIREIIYGKKRALRYWEITTDIETLPENLTWYVMTLASGSLS
jgi:SRSO17 transposase